MLNRVNLNRAKLNRAFQTKKKLPYGYYTTYSYMGYLNSIGGFMEFESETAYLEYLEDHEEES